MGQRNGDHDTLRSRQVLRGQRGIVRMSWAKATGQALRKADLIDGSMEGAHVRNCALEGSELLSSQAKECIQVFPSPPFSVQGEL